MMALLRKKLAGYFERKPDVEESDVKESDIEKI